MWEWGPGIEIVFWGWGTRINLTPWRWGTRITITIWGWGLWSWIHIYYICKRSDNNNHYRWTNNVISYSSICEFLIYRIVSKNNRRGLGKQVWGNTKSLSGCWRGHTPKNELLKGSRESGVTPSGFRDEFHIVSYSLTTLYHLFIRSGGWGVWPIETLHKRCQRAPRVNLILHWRVPPQRLLYRE